MSVIHDHNIAVPEPEEVANSLHIPDAAEAAQVKGKEGVSQV